MRIRPFVISLSLVCVVCLVTAGLGQTIFGTILGTVTDPSGAVMPNVVVTVTNQGENTSRELRSDAQGNFQAENLKPGTYTVAARSATGFKEISLNRCALGSAASRARRLEAGDGCQ